MKLNDFTFSFSGLENKIQDFMAAGNAAQDVAAYTLNSVVNAVYRVTKAARKEYPGLEIVFSGGVASNSMLRQEFSGTDAVFALPQFSTDNAMGVAVLTHRLLG